MYGIPNHSILTGLFIRNILLTSGVQAHMPITTYTYVTQLQVHSRGSSCPLDLGMLETAAG